MRVLIVGAGPVGLGAALELARFGVPSLVIEKHATTSWHPKTRNFNTRTMEIARGWGAAVYQRLRNIDTPDGWKSPIRFSSTALGKDHGVIESKGFEGPGLSVSPALPVMSSQEMIEEIMLDAAHATGLVAVRFNCEATRLLRGGAASDPDVALEVKDRISGTAEVLEGPALVAADGAASLIRAQLDLKLEGRKDLAHLVNCYFRAPIEQYLNDRKGVLFFVSNAKARGVLQPLDAAGRWLCQISVEADEWAPEVFTKERARDWIKAAVGADDIEPEVFSLGFWKLNATVVERLVVGRVVMCGDAAHQFPPTGGLGVNTGLQGMHNAMWKLALCLKGVASWSLLDTYDTERRPVAVRITQQSLQNSTNVGRIQAAAIAGSNSGLQAEEIITASRRYGNHLGVEFGAWYRSDAVIADGTTPPPVDDSYSDYVASATPGCRAPHVWLGRGESRLSTLDLIGSGFTLLASSSATDWCEQARALSEQSDVLITIYRVGAAGLAESGDFETAYGVTNTGAVLVRPDGHVAWRAVAAPQGPNELDNAIGQILGRTRKALQPAA